MIGIIDTGGANLASLQNAFERLGLDSKVSIDLDILNQASHLILPGVGHAKVAMEKLKNTGLKTYILEDKRPILGICLGMQLLFSELEEGHVDGLGIIPGKVAKLKPQENFQVPHMGWTNLEINSSNSKLLRGISAEDSFYFVHSFATPMNNYVTSYVIPFEDLKNTSNSEEIIQTNKIIGNITSEMKTQNPIPATVEFNNFFGAQFHPEKSGLVGEKFLKNFLKLS
jgi:imidazole glycerol-phosphate synthase subunit HisH